MLPSLISADVRSAAERRLFERLRRELGPEWVVLHSLGLVVHQRKPWAELDFVLIGPPGVLCLEVKGGRLRREAGEWVFIDRHGHEARKTEGPFEQAGSASAALRHYLLAHDGRLRDITVGFAVATPDVVFDIVGPDIDNELILDSRDSGTAAIHFVQRAFGRWTQRLGRPGRRLDAPAVERVTAALRADFDARPSVIGAIQNAEGAMVELTEQQCAAFDTLCDNERVVVSGGAGTGKSVLAVVEANRLAAEGKRVLLTCFGRRLARLLQEQVGDGVKVINLHALMAEIVRTAPRRVEIPDASTEDLMRVFYPEACLEVLIEGDAPFDAIVIDEAQDLLVEANLDVLDSLVAGGLREGVWRIFHDPLQDIFDGTATNSLVRLDTYRPARQRLSINCRNTAPIATMTAIMTESPLVETTTVDGPDVEVLTYRDDADQRRQLGKVVNRLRSGGVALGDIVILGPRARSASCVAGDNLPGLASTQVCGLDDGAGLAYSTIADYKGLEARAVVLVDLDDLDAFGRLPLLYVGTTRPRAWLTLLLSERGRDQLDLRSLRFGERLTQQVGPAPF